VRRFQAERVPIPIANPHDRPGCLGGCSAAARRQDLFTECPARLPNARAPDAVV